MTVSVLLSFCSDGLKTVTRDVLLRDSGHTADKCSVRAWHAKDRAGESKESES